MEILIIDDSIEVCESLSLLVETFNFESKYFTSSKEGLSYFTSELNPILFLDIHLPDSKGTEILPYIKELSPFTQVIMITGETDISNIISSFKNHASDFLFKPFSVESVKTAINRATKYYIIQKENSNYQEQLDYNIKFISKVQKSILYPKVDSENFFAEFSSKDQNSGNFYYNFDTENYFYGIVGNVENKEPTSALVGLLAISIFKECIIKGKKISEFLSEINSQIYYKINLHSITCFAYIINKKSKSLSYSLLGLAPPVLFSSKEMIQFKQNKESILGVMPNIKIEENEILIPENSYLVSYNYQSSMEKSMNQFLDNLSKSDNLNLELIKSEAKKILENSSLENEDILFYLQKI